MVEVQCLPTSETTPCSVESNRIGNREGLGASSAPSFHQGSPHDDDLTFLYGTQSKINSGYQQSCVITYPLPQGQNLEGQRHQAHYFQRPPYVSRMGSTSIQQSNDNNNSYLQNSVYFSPNGFSNTQASAYSPASGFSNPNFLNQLLDTHPLSSGAGRRQRLQQKINRLSHELARILD